MGKVSGAHLNPAVSLAPEVISVATGPGYIVVQLARPACAAGRRCVGHVRVELPSFGLLGLGGVLDGVHPALGLVSVILGTASGAQNLGIVGAFGVGGYIALAGLWGSPISGRR